MFEKNQNERTETQVPAKEGQVRGAYDAPQLFAIGTAAELLRGSGRHKNDDTGSRGFVVG